MFLSCFYSDARQRPPHVITILRAARLPRQRVLFVILWYYSEFNRKKKKKKKKKGQIKTVWHCIIVYTRKFFFSQTSKERSTGGTVFRLKLWMRSRSTASKMPTTALVIKIWTTEADQLASPSTYKYKVIAWTWSVIRFWKRRASNIFTYLFFIYGTSHRWCKWMFCKYYLLLIKVDSRDMDTEITMSTSESPMETASPRDVDISNEVLQYNCRMFGVLG